MEHVPKKRISLYRHLKETDPVKFALYKEGLRSNERIRYSNDPEFRARKINNHTQRYKNDSDYRAKCLEVSHKQYARKKQAILEKALGLQMSGISEISGDMNLRVCGNI